MLSLCAVAWAGMGVFSLAGADADIFSGRRGDASGPWQSRNFRYVVVDQDIKGVMAEFGRSVGVRTEISTNVRARLQNRRINQQSTVFLNGLAKEYALQWYYDGSALYITTVGEAVTRLIPLGPVSADRLQAELRHLGLFDGRYTFKFTPTTRMVLVSGPPRFVATVEAALATLSDNRNRQIFTIIRGGRVTEDSVVPLQK